jgi:hypothetical protein
MIKRVLAAALLPFVLITLAVAGEDPGGLAKKTLQDLEAKRANPALSGSTHHPPALDAASYPIQEARKLLARAAELRTLGDSARAELAEDGALEWALTAREIVKAVELEHDAVDQAASADGAASKAQKARALLDEAIARRAKLQTELDRLEKEAEERALDAGPPAASNKPKKVKP